MFASVEELKTNIMRNEVVSFINLFAKLSKTISYIKMIDGNINKAKEKNIYNIRIDTHNDNISMLSFLKKNNFSYCGIISITCDFNDFNSLRNLIVD